MQVDVEPAAVALDCDALYDIVAQSWGAYLGRPDGEQLTRIPDPGPLDVVASISLTGAWDGHVIIGSTEPAARSIAAAMLDIEPDQVEDTDINDAASELVNVVAGNIKSVLPRPCQLSLPMTTRRGRRVRYPGTRPLCSFTVALNDEPVTVAVRQLHLS